MKLVPRNIHFQTNLDFDINVLDYTLTSLSCWEIIFRTNSYQLSIVCQVFYEENYIIIGKSKKINSYPNQYKYSIMLKLTLKLFDQRI